jgi:aquaporin Z
MTAMDARKLGVEAVGTAILVFFGAGVALLSFGFGLTGSSLSAGVVTTAATFGLVLGVLVYTLGPLSGCHINPAVTLGFLVSRRIGLQEAVNYWVAQVLGAIIGALVLWGAVHTTQVYRNSMGLGENGFDAHSIVRVDAGGAFLVEVVLTFVFVFVVLSATRANAPPLVAGAVIGMALFSVHLVGIAFTGMSVNPARSLGPALFVGGDALNQLWVFILAPLVGAALAAGCHLVVHQTQADTEPPRTVTLPDQRPATVGDEVSR